MGSERSTDLPVIRAWRWRCALLTLALAGTLASSGCGPGARKSTPNESALDPCGRFAPTWVRFVGLTAFQSARDATTTGIRAYVDVLDAFDCRIKAPGRFRFELYEYVPRSSNPCGRRVHLWDDMDLNDAAANSDYWRDFLRCYQFELPLAVPLSDDSYVLQVTYLTIQGKHLSGTMQLAYPP